MFRRRSDAASERERDEPADAAGRGADAADAAGASADAAGAAPAQMVTTRRRPDLRRPRSAFGGRDRDRARDAARARAAAVGAAVARERRSSGLGAGGCSLLSSRPLSPTAAVRTRARRLSCDTATMPEAAPARAGFSLPGARASASHL